MKYNEPWQQFFEMEAPRYLDNIFTKNSMAEVEFMIQELNIQPGDSILDIGCGPGRHAIELAARGYQVTGIDLSPHQLEVGKKMASQKGVSVEFIQGDASQTVLDQTFHHCISICEGAFSLLNVHENSEEYHMRLLNNIFQMLKPGGKFLLNVLSAFRMIRLFNDSDVESGRFDVNTISEINEIETKSGEKVKIREKGFFPSELQQLLIKSGFKIHFLGGGTAGNWSKHPLQLDEYEIMAICEK